MIFQCLTLFFQVVYYYIPSQFHTEVMQDIYLFGVSYENVYIEIVMFFFFFFLSIYIRIYDGLHNTYSQGRKFVSGVVVREKIEDISYFLLYAIFSTCMYALDFKVIYQTGKIFHRFIQLIFFTLVSYSFFFIA